MDQEEKKSCRKMSVGKFKFHWNTSKAILTLSSNWLRNPFNLCLAFSLYYYELYHFHIEAKSFYPKWMKQGKKKEGNFSHLNIYVFFYKINICMIIWYKWILTENIEWESCPICIEYFDDKEWELATSISDKSSTFQCEQEETKVNVFDIIFNCSIIEWVRNCLSKRKIKLNK